MTSDKYNNYKEDSQQEGFGADFPYWKDNGGKEKDQTTRRRRTKKRVGGNRYSELIKYSRVFMKEK